MDTTAPTVIIGAGPGGLATAAALSHRGITATVLERGSAVGTSWRGHYDRLHLHTTRRLSRLPGLDIPQEYGRWVSRDNVVRYLEQYTAHHQLDVRCGIETHRVDRVGDQWAISVTGAREQPGARQQPGARSTDAGEGRPATAAWTLTATTVVVATGYNHTPHIPDWPGREAFTGNLIHAGRYRNAAPYAGKDVLVVGAGNTGAEIAVDLAAGGASRVRLAVRTPPNIVRREVAGVSAQALGILTRRLPPPLVDWMSVLTSRISIPDLSAHGLPRPTEGVHTRITRDGAIPIQDVGLIDAVRHGKVEVVQAVTGFDADAVLLADDTTLTPDAVIVATGYRRGLESLVGHLGVLDASGCPATRGPTCPRSAPGLYFTGYTNPISGMFRELNIDARRIAKAIGRCPATP